MRHDDEFNAGFIAEIEKRGGWEQLAKLGPLLKQYGPKVLKGLGWPALFAGTAAYQTYAGGKSDLVRGSAELTNAADSMSRLTNAFSGSTSLPAAGISALAAPLLFPAEDEKGKKRSILHVDNLKRMLYGALLGGFGGAGIDYLRNPTPGDIASSSQRITDAMGENEGRIKDLVAHSTDAVTQSGMSPELERALQ